MKKTVSVVAALSFLTMGAIAGCSDASGDSATADGGGAAGEPATLENLEGAWSYRAGQVDGTDLTPPEGDPVELVIEPDGSFHGYAGCNSIMGTAAVTEGSIDLGAIGATRMACEEPQMAFETAYLGALDAVNEGTVDGDNLILMGDQGELHYLKQN